MPTYRYECCECGPIEVWQSIFDDRLEDCPDCGKRVWKVMVPPRISRDALPNKTPSRTPPRTPDNAWERGIARDHRGMPYLNEKGSEIGVKEFAQNRGKYEARIRELRNSPDPFKQNA